ncbi:helix-turn-helix transcriptional regulator [Aquimarina sp. M1]
MMKNPNELISPHAVFLSISEVGKLFSPPISRQKIARLIASGELPLIPLKIGKRFCYHKEHTITLILQLAEKDDRYDLDASL